MSEPTEQTTRNLAELYDDRYQSGGAHWENAPGKAVIIQALRRFCPNQKPLRLLDIGCGTGSFLMRILMDVSSAWNLHGIDFSEVAIQQAREQHRQIQFQCGDATILPFANDSFEAVTCYGSWEHFEKPAAAIAEASRILAPGGHVFAMLPTLGIHRTDRADEGWYEDTEVPGATYRQMQWNLKWETWSSMFARAGLTLMENAVAAGCGANKPQVFYFGVKEVVGSQA